MFLPSFEVTAHPDQSASSRGAGVNNRLLCLASWHRDRSRPPAPLWTIGSKILLRGKRVLRRFPETRRKTVPVEEDGLHQGHHVTAGVVTCAHDGHVDGLWRRRQRLENGTERNRNMTENHSSKKKLMITKKRKKTHRRSTSTEEVSEYLSHMSTRK